MPLIASRQKGFKKFLVSGFPNKSSVNNNPATPLRSTNVGEPQRNRIVYQAEDVVVGPPELYRLFSPCVIEFWRDWCRPGKTSVPRKRLGNKNWYLLRFLNVNEALLIQSVPWMQNRNSDGRRNIISSSLALGYIIRAFSTKTHWLSVTVYLICRYPQYIYLFGFPLLKFVLVSLMVCKFFGGGVFILVQQSAAKIISNILKFEAWLQDVRLIIIGLFTPFPTLNFVIQNGAE